MKIRVIRGIFSWCNLWQIFFHSTQIFLIMDNLLFHKETYAIIGLCMEVHKILGHGFSEIVYKDALMYEAMLNYSCCTWKGIWNWIQTNHLATFLFCWFWFLNNIIVEVKANEGAINDSCLSQTLNYLRASDCRVGLN